MLVLTRKVDQSIEIDGGIIVQVIKLKGNAVRLGIQAPDDVQIVRSELKEWTPPASHLSALATPCFGESMSPMAQAR